VTVLGAERTGEEVGPMVSITMTNMTPITRVRFASPQAADCSLTFGVRSAFDAALIHEAPAAKDVAYFGFWRPPV
jgi:hypothetical protein